MQIQDDGDLMVIGDGEPIPSRQIAEAARKALDDGHEVALMVVLDDQAPLEQIVDAVETIWKADAVGGVSLGVVA